MAETTEQYRARINQLKTEIETEPLIKEMRSDIAEGISKTGNRQADIEVRQDTLEDDFVAVQQDASSASPSGAEVAVARGSYPTLDERLTKKEQEVTAQLAQISQQKSTIGNFHTNTFSLVLAGIDSLTNGAGESSYLDYFAPRIRGELGDGGPGYVPIDYTFASEEGYDFGKSGGMSYIEAAIPGQYPAKYSFDLKGLYCDAGVEEYLTLKINHKWKHGKLFYLNQTGGGSFKVGYVPENTSIHDVVNTQSSNFSIGVYDFPDNDDAKQGHIKCSSINGKVVIFGGLFWNDEGVAVSRIGRGGRKFADIAKIEPSFLSAWINELSPKMFIFNGGMNDRLDMTATDFKLNLESYLLPFKASGTQLTLISPNLIDGDNTRLKEYDEQLIDFANINHVDYLSDAKLFGSYSQANMEGYMFDGIHPNDTGNKKRSNNILSYYSIPLIGVNKTELNGSSDNVSKQYITDLSVKNLYIKAGETKKLYKIGLINGYPNGLIEFTVTGSVDGTAMMRKKIFRSVVANGGISNQVNTFDATPRVTSVDEAKWGTITKVDFQLTFEGVDNQLLVKITPDSLDVDSIAKNMNFTVEGKVTLIFNTVVGQSVFENSIV